MAKKRDADADAVLVAATLEGMSRGQSLREIAKAKRVPLTTLWRVVSAADPEQYARARERQADSHADRALELAELTAAGEVDPQAARVAIDTLKWRAGRLAPKNWGDRQTVEHGGAVQFRVEYTEADE